MGRPQFDGRLEGLRGIAALIVCINHAMSAFPGGAPAPLGWLIYVFNPAASVMFFFVLSGHVLGLALERDGDLIKYGVRRLFRLLPAFVFSILFAFACVTLVRIEPAPDAFTSYFRHQFWPAPTFAQLSDNLVLVSSWVNGPTWSIWPELVGSAFLPFVVVAHRMLTPRWQWPLFIAASIALAFSPLRLVFWFYAGFFLVRRIGKIIADRKLVAAGSFIAGFMALRVVAGYVEYYKTATVYPSALAATLLIGSVISSRSFMAWTEIAPIRFLGRISYSFYLLHWPIFYLSALAVRWAYVDLGNVAVMLLTVALTLATASVSYRYIEVPSISCRFRQRVTMGVLAILPIRQVD